MTLGPHELTYGTSLSDTYIWCVRDYEHRESVIAEQLIAPSL